MKGVKRNQATRRRAGARRWGALTLTLLASAIWLGAPLSAWAGNKEERLKVEWQEHYREVTLEYQDASAALQKAELDHRKARQRNRLKGARREELMGALAAAEARYATAKLAKDGFPEAARKAGVPPGWFR